MLPMGHSGGPLKKEVAAIRPKHNSARSVEGHSGDPLKKEVGATRPKHNHSVEGHSGDPLNLAAVVRSNEFPATSSRVSQGGTSGGTGNCGDPPKRALMLGSSRGAAVIRSRTSSRRCARTLRRSDNMLHAPFLFPGVMCECVHLTCPLFYMPLFPLGDRQ